MVPSWIWLSLDWRQAELYLICLFAKDVKLREALQSSDVHRLVMGLARGIPPEQVTKQQREVSKVLWYALIYSGFDIDSCISSAYKSAKGTISTDDLKSTLDIMLSEFSSLMPWATQTLFDYWDNEGRVYYLLNQSRKIIYPDYLKREEKALRKSKEGRIAINTIGQASVGLLLKLLIAGIQKDEWLSSIIKQPIPLFDALYFLTKTETCAEVQAKVDCLATPVLRLDGFEIRMRTEWSASLVSWGDMKSIPDPILQEPRIFSWESKLPIPKLEYEGENIPVAALNPFARSS